MQKTSLYKVLAPVLAAGTLGMSTPSYAYKLRFNSEKPKLLSLYNDNRQGNSLESRLFNNISWSGMELAQNDEPCPPYLKCNKKDVPASRKNDDTPYKSPSSSENSAPHYSERSHTGDWVLFGSGVLAMFVGYLGKDSVVCSGSMSGEAKCGPSAVAYVSYFTLIGGAGMSLVGLIGLLSK